MTRRQARDLERMHRPERLRHANVAMQRKGARANANPEPNAPDADILRASRKRHTTRRALRCQ